MLLVFVVGCWDQYRFSGCIEEQIIYNLGLEWCLLISLLFCGSYGISFCVLDLNYIYQVDVNGYYLVQKDYYGCEKGVDGVCKNGWVDYVQSGMFDLKFECGCYWSYGFVWLLLSRFDFFVDYYYIQIDDLLIIFDLDKLLCDEVVCCSGGFDLDLVQCCDILVWVECNVGDVSVDLNCLNKVYVNVINVVKECISGIDLCSNICWGVGDYGVFFLIFGYILVLFYDYQQFDDYFSENQCDSFDFYDWCSKFNVSLIWDYVQFILMFFVVCYGSVINVVGSGCLSLWMVFNVSVCYWFNECVSVGLMVNNLFDQIKEDDFDGWLYYFIGNYDVMGC